MLRTCGDGVSLTFLAVMRCSLNLFAVLRCSEPPPPSHAPLLTSLMEWPAWLKCRDTGAVVLSCWLLFIQDRTSTSVPPVAFIGLTVNCKERTTCANSSEVKPDLCEDQD